ncbi:MAG: MBL fold metallo-hydrolase [Chloroflexi bacterium]|nr:MBL fold metallo-hydrolase [Chloroflexota bacterium]
MIYEVGTRSKVYCIESAGNARVFFVGAPEYTLIDAGIPGKADKILSALAQIGVQPLQVKRIILTHHHWDHVGSLWELKKRTGAEIVAHLRDAEYITGKRVRRAPRRALGRLAYTLFTLFGAHDVQSVEVDRRVNDGDPIGGFSVVHTPGHTPGHICLLRDGYLFSGDLLQATAGEFRETAHIFTADVPTARASIRRVAELEFQFILSAHHPPHVFGSTDKVRALAHKLGTLA